MPAFAFTIPPARKRDDFPALTLQIRSMSASKPMFYVEIAQNAATEHARPLE